MSLPLRSTLALVLLVCLAYSHGWYDRFIFDDLALIELNANIRSLDRLPDLIGVSGKVPAHRVIRNVSYALDYALWRDNPRGYHLTNLLIHLFNVLLVFALGRLWIPEGPWAFIAALLWGIHPVQTEAVTYLSGRRDVLSALFYLAAFYCYRLWRTRLGSRWMLLGSALAYIAGCFTKEVAVTLPAILFAWELVLACGAATTNRVRHVMGEAMALLRDAWAYFLVVAVFPVAFTLYVLKAHPFNVIKGYMTPQLKTDIPTLAIIGVHYIWLLIFPQNLSMDYFPVSIVPATGWGDPRALVALAILTALAICTILATWRGTPIAFGALWFIITFLPMSNLFVRSNEPVAEHYLYLPSVGFCWVVSLTLRALLVRWPGVRPVVWVVVLGASLALLLRTDRRNRDWEDPEQIYKASLAVFPQNSRLWNNLGAYYREHGEFEKARAMYEKALSLSPGEPLYLANLGGMLRQAGRYEEAEKHYRKALTIVKDFPNALLGLAYTHLKQKKFAEAVSEYDQLVGNSAIDPWIVQYWRAITLREKGDLEPAVIGFTEALRISPGNADSLWQRAATRMEQAKHASDPARASGFRAAAEADLREGLAVLPDSPVLYGTLGELYEQQHQPEKALQVYEEMRKVNPEYTADSLTRQERIYRALGRLKEAGAIADLARSLGLSRPNP